MVYQNKVVAAIKVNGRVLREINDSVIIPFGSEYSVLIKNLNSVRIKFQLSVDSKNATSNTWLVIPPNSDLELERFIRNGNWSEGNRFKFIERSPEIEAYRGILPDDGIVRIEFQTEVVREVIPTPIRRYYDEWVPRPTPYPWRKPRPYNITRAMGRPGEPRPTHPQSARYASAAPSRVRAFMDSSGPRSDVGITVPGSRSNQSFYPAHWFETTGQSEVIVLRLKGEVEGRNVERPVTVDTKVTCSTCGKSSKAIGDYCSRCGTALVLV